MNKVRNGLELICWGVDMRESIGGFRADGRHAEGADAKEMLENTGLFEADILNSYEVNYVSGTRKE